MPLPLITGPIENQLIFHCGHSSLHLDEQYGKTGELDVSLVVHLGKPVLEYQMKMISQHYGLILADMWAEVKTV